MHSYATTLASTDSRILGRTPRPEVSLFARVCVSTYSWIRSYSKTPNDPQRPRNDPQRPHTIHNDPTTNEITYEDQYQVFHGLHLVLRASARASWKTGKDCELEPILLNTLMIKNVKNINKFNFELFQKSKNNSKHNDPQPPRIPSIVR